MRTWIGSPTELRTATRAVKRAERVREEEIYRASLAGNSLRAIALETDLSHETVRVVIRNMAAWVEREQRILENPAGGFTFVARARNERSIARRRAALEKLTKRQSA